MIKNLPASARDARGKGSIPALLRSAGVGSGNPLQYSCLENFRGQKSLVGYSPWGSKELDRTEQLNTHIHSLDFFFLRLCHRACRTLVPQPGIQPVLPALEPWSLNHWSTREVVL